ncbi:hypothetical protein GQ607_011242 [Colletotrichum asianum]|uniref:Uncharacterized protein n=1 Tax=Colletotrichum asianum TaxID=702518 RepID=A0A8H3WBC3_9PEZI|nr:hypothetical protein GQ607_011242 [Colletotrichum asianum]
MVRPLCVVCVLEHPLIPAGSYSPNTAKSKTPNTKGTTSSPVLAIIVVVVIFIGVVFNRLDPHYLQYFSRRCNRSLRRP